MHCMHGQLLYGNVKSSYRQKIGKDKKLTTSVRLMTKDIFFASIPLRPFTRWELGLVPDNVWDVSPLRRQSRQQNPRILTSVLTSNRGRLFHTVFFIEDNFMIGTYTYDHKINIL